MNRPASPVDLLAGFDAALRPDPVLLPSEWADAHRIPETVDVKPHWPLLATVLCQLVSGPYRTSTRKASAPGYLSGPPHHHPRSAFPVFVIVNSTTIGQPTGWAESARIDRETSPCLAGSVAPPATMTMASRPKHA